VSNNNEMTCQELVEVITNYLENKMSPAERARFETHLAGCKGCTNYLNQMRRTIKVVGELTEETIEPQAKDELLKVFRTWKRT
jgi:predicted anti-sigma-YlaC factor YlaD